MNGVFTKTCCGKFLGLLLVWAGFLSLANPLGAAYRVTGLEVSAVDGSAAVTIEADAPPSYGYFTIGEPEPRVVVDFSDAVHGLPKYRFGDLETRLISGIRTSQYRPYPQPSVRIVLDMPRLVPFQMKSQENRLVISLEAPSEDDLAEEEQGQTASRAPISEDEEARILSQDVEVQAPSAEVEGQTPAEKSDQVVEDHTMTSASAEDSVGSAEVVTDHQEPEKEAESKHSTLGIREPVSYSSGGRRDPFVALPGGQEVEFGQAPLPNVERLTIVGILRGTDGYRALVQDTDQNGYVLRAGDQVLYGYVASIEEQRVVFRLNERGLDRTVILKLVQ